MDSFFGIPAHPLFVHIPAVLLPLAAIGVIAMVIRPAWYERYRWAVLGVGFAGTLGAILAASAGEGLEEQIVAAEGPAAQEGWEDHAEFGEFARTVAIVFFVVARVVRPRPVGSWDTSAGRSPGSAPSVAPKWLTFGLAALVLVASAGTVYTVIQAGHSGAKAVWCEVSTPPNCDEAEAETDEG